MNGDKSGTHRDRNREEETNRSVSFCFVRSGVNPFRFLPSAFSGGGGGGGGGEVCAFFVICFLRHGSGNRQRSDSPKATSARAAPAQTGDSPTQEKPE